MYDHDPSNLSNMISNGNSNSINNNNNNNSMHYDMRHQPVVAVAVADSLSSPSPILDLYSDPFSSIITNRLVQSDDYSPTNLNNNAQQQQQQQAFSSFELSKLICSLIVTMLENTHTEIDMHQLEAELKSEQIYYAPRSLLELVKEMPYLELILKGNLF